MTDRELNPTGEEAIEDLEAPADMQGDLSGGSCYNPTCYNADSSIVGVCVDPTCRQGGTTADCGGGDSRTIIVRAM